MLARRRHKIREPVEKLKRRELDDAIGSRLRGLSLSAWPDPERRPDALPMPHEIRPSKVTNVVGDKNRRRGDHGLNEPVVPAW